MISEQQYSPDERLDFSVIIAVFRAMQTVKKSESITLDRGKLTSSQFSVLETLYHKGPLRVCELLEKTLSSGGNMTVVLKNLQQDGLILKVKDPEDGRAFVVQLTGKGFQLIDGIFPDHIKEVQSLLSPLTDEEKRELVRILKKLNRI
ncbi:MAG: MarR family transcriptional regulator [Spirochaetales bacterium]|nr:MarR family transcriptional regulator [Spirochaetales bacterium]